MNKRDVVDIAVRKEALLIIVIHEHGLLQFSHNKYRQ